MKQKCFLIIVFLFSRSLFAQEIPKTLNAEQVLELVRNFHPIVRQANIGIEKSRAEILNARGNFDPIFNFYMGQKTLDGLEYYKELSSELKIPAWYGMEFYVGADNLIGNRLNPTQTKGENSYVGVNFSLAKNLVMDKRRAVLKQSKIFNSMAKVEQRLLVNDLCMEAMTAYWEWVKAFQTYKIVDNMVVVNEKRVEMIQKSFLNGERSEIEITEAITQLQSFQYQKNENWLAFQNSGLQLSVFLWTNDDQPYQLPESVIPQDAWENEKIIANFNLSLSDMLLEAQLNHPYLKMYNFKLDVLEIERKLKFQDLLPKIDFQYNFLTKSYNLLNTFGDASPFNNNYQFGLKAEIPLLFSQGRANYKISKLKIDETQLELNQNQLNIEVKVKSYFNEFETLKNQVALQSQNLENCQKLVKAEETKFQNGESSLFLINTRENKALEAQEKLIEVKTKYYKSIFSLQWSVGILQ